MEAVWQNYSMDESIHTSGTTQPERRYITRQLARTVFSLARLVDQCKPGRGGSFTVSWFTVNFEEQPGTGDFGQLAYNFIVYPNGGAIQFSGILQFPQFTTYYYPKVKTTRYPMVFTRGGGFSLFFKQNNVVLRKTMRYVVVSNTRTILAEKLPDLEVTTPRGCIIPRGVPNRLILHQDQNYIHKSADSLCTQRMQHMRVVESIIACMAHMTGSWHSFGWLNTWQHPALPLPPSLTPSLPPSLPPPPPPSPSLSLRLPLPSLRLSRHLHTSFLAEFSPNFCSCNVYCNSVSK